MRLKDKVAVITGASQGYGMEIARGFAEEINMIRACIRACAATFGCYIIVSFGGLALAKDVDSEGATARPDVDWPLYGGNHESHHFSPLAEINSETVRDLGLVWETPLDTPNLVAEPIVIDGKIYISGAFSIVSAYDAMSGKHDYKKT